MKNNDKSLAIPMSEEELREIRNFTGESKMSKVKKIPFIVFDGKTGKFSKTTDEKDMYGKTVLEEIGTELECTIIRCRKQISSGKSCKQKVYSDEFESYNDVVSIFDREGGGVVDTASYKVLRDRYGKDMIKLSEIVYVVYEEKFWRMSVKGTSLQPLWGYLSSFGNDDTVLRYKTKISSIAESNEFGDFMVLTFEKGDAVENWKDLWAGLKELDSSITATIIKKEDLLLNEPADNIKTVSMDELGSEFDSIENNEDEIKIEDIPF